MKGRNMSAHGISYKVYGSSRDCSIKVPLTSSEFEVFNLKEKRIKSFFKENGLLYNQTEFFRILLLNFDDSDLVSLMSKLYRNDVNPAFYITS